MSHEGIKVVLQGLRISTETARALFVAETAVEASFGSVHCVGYASIKQQVDGWIFSN
jgi:hypothetical protein